MFFTIYYLQQHNMRTAFALDRAIMFSPSKRGHLGAFSPNAYCRSAFLYAINEDNDAAAAADDDEKRAIRLRLYVMHLLEPPPNLYSILSEFLRFECINTLQIRVFMFKLHSNLMF